MNLCGLYKVPVSLHSCGIVMEVLPDLIDFGIVMYNPVDPTSGADICEVFKKYGDKICVSGNIDIAGVLVFGSPTTWRRTYTSTSSALPGRGTTS